VFFHLGVGRPFDELHKGCKFLSCLLGQVSCGNHCFVWNAHTKSLSQPKRPLNACNSLSGAVDETFGSREFGGRCADVTGIIKTVAANGEASVMSFGLPGPDGGNDAAIGDFAAGGNFFFGGKKIVPVPLMLQEARTPWAIRLGLGFKLIGKNNFPNSFVRALDKMAVFLDLASHGIGHWVGLLLGVVWGKKLLGDVVDIVRLLLWPCGVLAMADWLGCWRWVEWDSGKLMGLVGWWLE
jgi:hypothetical protein